ncbi:MAG TPA: ATP pyrophosphatase [Nitrospiraceae bacterium]|nr:ATP pyrophosphatase [Nitrospiraceae bacterium]
MGRYPSREPRYEVYRGVGQPMSGTGSYLVSWSGGKDSCFACHQARKQGMKISRLVHFDRPFNLHGVGPELIACQAEMAGIPLINRKVANKDFEREFKDTVSELKKSDTIHGMVFGDIYLEPHREWIERVCGELGIEAVLPLWGMRTERIAHDFLGQGFDAVVVSGREQDINREWIGRRLDRSFLEYLHTHGLDPCGENGEYHTFVVAGPLFTGKIEIAGSKAVQRDGHWLLNIGDYAVSVDAKQGEVMLDIS